MKKFVDYIMAQPVWKVLLYGLGILFMIFNPKIILSILFLGGAIALWYFAKKKPNVAKRNIAALVAILGAGGVYLTNPHTVSTTQEEQTQATHFASTPSKKASQSKKQRRKKKKKSATKRRKKNKNEKKKKIATKKRRKNRNERKKKNEIRKRPKQNNLQSKLKLLYKP